MALRDALRLSTSLRVFLLLRRKSFTRLLLNHKIDRALSRSVPAASLLQGKSQARKDITILGANAKSAHTSLSFEDHTEAYRSKSTWEILRALVVFRMCCYDYLVDNNAQLMKLGRRIFGKRLFELGLRMTMYGHFVAGVDQDEIKPVLSKMRQYGVKSIMDYSAEEDLSAEEAQTAEIEGILPNADQKESTFYTERYAAHPELGDRRENVISARTYFYLNEAQCEKNTEIILNCIDAVSGATSGTGFAAVKVTALCRPHLLMQLSQIVVRMREFFRLLTGDKSYNIFQENVPRIKRQQFTDKMKELGIPITEEKCNEFFTMMDVDQNGEIGLFEWERLLKLKVKMSQYFMLPNAETGKLEPIIAPLSDDEEEAFINMMRRLNLIVERARERDVRVMIDAEQSYFQPAINRLCIEMMRKFNTDKSVIFNTYQCYLKGAYDSIKMDLDFAKRSNFYFGAKIVRGAYMEQERARAQSLGYVDPINATYEATNAMYERVVDTCMQHVRGRGFQQVAIMMATHNENTVRMAIQKMQEYGIGPQDKVICFGQLLGMCDQVSFSLGQAGYSVYKYVPYGPIEKVLPYLARRAQENKSLLKGAVKERRMLWLELKRRLRHLEISARPPLALPAAPPVSQATPTH